MSSAAADTIVLKNGRRIVASSVTEDGDRVRYETPAGTMSIPKSIVARIDRDGLGYSSGSTAASEPPVSAPHVDPVRGYDDISRLVIHDNAIDFSYLAQVETDARSHAPLAIEKVAAAHYAAAQFLESKGDTASAIDHYREALSFAPDNLRAAAESGGDVSAPEPVHFGARAAGTRAAHSRRIRRTSPSSTAGPTTARTKWIWRLRNGTAREKLRPDAEVERALEKAERDKAEEESYREGETAHFNLKYNGNATPDLARGIMRVLEDDFRDLESQLDYTPPDSIGVILYTGPILRGHHPRAELGGRVERWPHAHSGAGPRRRHAGAGTRVKT